ncbi:MAG TPA: immunoglobulin domain-containing protein, partial [Flavobacteriales bacterium]|nr:immunoglobulin domain-containing protein [Flavobacteriales bacterium]
MFKTLNPRTITRFTGILMIACTSITAWAQPGDVNDIDVRLIQSTPTQLEVQVRPNNAWDVTDGVMNMSFAIRWLTSAGGTLVGNSSQSFDDCMNDGARLLGNPGIVNYDTTIAGVSYRYRGYSCIGAGWAAGDGCGYTANTWIPYARINVTNLTGCATFEIVTSDALTMRLNSNFFVSLGGISIVQNSTVVAPGVQLGSCAADCLGVIGGTALPGTPCNDNNACTTNDVYTGTAPNCGCSGTPIAGPSITASGSNSPICAGSTLNLNVTATGTGTITYTWNGPGGYTSSAEDPTRTNATAAMTGTYTVTASNGCGTNASATVAVTVSATPTAAAAGPDQSVCATTATLAGNTITTGTGTWTTSSGATIANPNSPTSGVSNLAVGANVFTWTSTNGICPSSNDAVTITRVAAPTTAAAGPDQSVCATTATLAGNTITTGTGTWT